MMKESYWGADSVIELLKKKGYDYSAHREVIAQEIFEDGLFQGNWDSSVHLNDPNLQDLRVIQEDEYDQHMDHNEDKPSWDDMVGYVDNGYLWLLGKSKKINTLKK